MSRAGLRLAWLFVLPAVRGSINANKISAKMRLSTANTPGRVNTAAGPVTVFVLQNTQLNEYCSLKYAYYWFIGEIPCIFEEPPLVCTTPGTHATLSPTWTARPWTCSASFNTRTTEAPPALYSMMINESSLPRRQVYSESE